MTTVTPAPSAVGYHNPLDFPDGGTKALDSGPDAGASTYSRGTVDDRNLDLTYALYLVTGLDGGQPRTEIALGDVANLCAFVSGGTMETSDDVVRMRLAGDIPGTYLVATALAPSGATAALQYRSDAGAFGTTRATAGTIELDGIDPENQQPSQGLYTLTFSATETLSGKFLAAPCAGLSAPGSGD